MPNMTPNALLHGTLDALILRTLAAGPRHGYAIAAFIEEASGTTVVVEEGCGHASSSRAESIRRPRARWRWQEPVTWRASGARAWSSAENEIEGCA